MKPKYYIFSLLLPITLIIGCASESPVSPGGQQMSDNRDSTQQATGRSLWGIWEITVDPDTCQAVITPMRYGGFHANIRKFFEEGPCTDCLKLEQPITPQPYGFDVDITLRHPFPDNTYFIGFDVRGIIMLEGTYEFTGLSQTYRTTKAEFGDPALLNPDGYTPLFNAESFTLPGILGYSRGKMIPVSWPDPTNNLNAFKAYYSPGQSEDEGGRRAFLTTGQITRTYQIQAPLGQPFKFWYAIDASWMAPSYAPPYSPNNFPYNANCPEAYRFDFEILEGALHVDGGAVKIDIKMWDHWGWDWAPQIWYVAPECTGDSATVISGSDIHSVFDDFYVEIEIANELGGLDPDLGAELFVFFTDPIEEDLFNGIIEGTGRFTIPVLPEPPDPIIHRISPSHGFDVSYIDEAVVEGENFQDGCTFHLEMVGQPNIIATDINFISLWEFTGDLDLVGCQPGLWDVVVTNPDSGQDMLEDSFEILSSEGCNDALHNNSLGSGDYDNGYFMEAYDTCFMYGTGLESDGQLLAYEIKPDLTNVVTFDVDTATPSDPIDLWEIPKSGSHHLIPVAIDFCEVLHRFFLSWGGSWVEDRAPDGTLMSKKKVTVWDSMVFAIDSDGSGGFWVAFFETGSKAEIKHFIPNATIGYSPILDDHFLTPCSAFSVAEIICIPDETLLILDKNGTIYAYDISASPPLLKGDLEIPFSFDLTSSGMSSNSSCDMAIDWRDPDLARCRIVVFGNLKDSGIELFKIDSDLNILAGPASFPTPHFQTILFNPEDGAVVLVAEIDGSPGGYVVIEEPDGW